MYLGDDTTASPVRMPSDRAVIERLTAKLNPSASPRRKRLTRIKQSVTAGEYENSLKLSIAVDRVLDALLKP